MVASATIAHASACRRHPKRIKHFAGQIFMYNNHPIGRDMSGRFRRRSELKTLAAQTPRGYAATR